MQAEILREVYSFGHLEYDRDTLAKEYFRDLDAGLDPHIPENYFKNDDIHELPCMRWSSSAALFSVLGKLCSLPRNAFLSGRVQKKMYLILDIYKRNYDIFRCF